MEVLLTCKCWLAILLFSGTLYHVGATTLPPTTTPPPTSTTPAGGQHQEGEHLECSFMGLEGIWSGPSGNITVQSSSVWLDNMDYACDDRIDEHYLLKYNNGEKMACVNILRTTEDLLVIEYLTDGRTRHVGQSSDVPDDLCNATRTAYDFNVYVRLGHHAFVNCPPCLAAHWSLVVDPESPLADCAVHTTLNGCNMADHLTLKVWDNSTSTNANDTSTCEEEFTTGTYHLECLHSAITDDVTYSLIRNNDRYICMVIQKNESGEKQINYYEHDHDLGIDHMTPDCMRIDLTDFPRYHKDKDCENEDTSDATNATTSPAVMTICCVVAMLKLLFL